MSDIEDSDSKPTTWNTDACERKPGVKLRLVYEEPFEARVDWYCQPCENAIVVGNGLPAGNTEVLRRV
jgi:hypothetical protein